MYPAIDSRKALHALRLIRQNMDRVENFFKLIASLALSFRIYLSQDDRQNPTVPRLVTVVICSPNSSPLFCRTFGSFPYMDRQYLPSFDHLFAPLPSHILRYGQPGRHENQTSYFTDLDQVLEVISVILQYSSGRSPIGLISGCNEKKRPFQTSSCRSFIFGIT